FYFHFLVEGLYVVGPVKSPLPVLQFPVIVPLAELRELLRKHVLIVRGQWPLIDLLAISQSVQVPYIYPAIFPAVSLLQKPKDEFFHHDLRTLGPRKRCNGPLAGQWLFRPFRLSNDRSHWPFGG